MSHIKYSKYIYKKLYQLRFAIDISWSKIHYGIESLHVPLHLARDPVKRDFKEEAPHVASCMASTRLLQYKACRNIVRNSFM